jgi:hypothetical protein
MKNIIKNNIALLLLLLVSTACADSNSSSSNKYEGGTKYVYDYVPTVVLEGSWQ